MRTLTDHKLNGLNDAILIQAMDDPGHGGANHHYKLDLIATPGFDLTAAESCTEIKFQNGPVKEAGFNGITNEALLAIVIDRLRGFQGLNVNLGVVSGSGPATTSNTPLPVRPSFACRENAIALTHLEDAMHWLQHRTRQRLARGVEGTNQA